VWRVGVPGTTHPVALSHVSERRSPSAGALAQALLDAPAGLTFAELLAAAPEAAPGEVAAWLGHALTEGLVDDAGTGPEGAREFRLRARGRRLLSARRRHPVH